MAQPYSIRYRVVSNRIPVFARQFDAQAQRAIRQTTYEIFGHSQQDVPRDTGNLARSGAVVQLTPWRYKIMYTADYSAYVHGGTRFTPARPFLIPWAEAAKPLLRTRFERIVRGG